MKLFLTLISILILLISCKQGEGSPGTEVSGNSYARGFTIERHEGFTVLEVSRPWQQYSESNGMKYVLGKDHAAAPDSLVALPFIKVPVKRVVALSTGYIAMLSALGEEESLVGISGSSFVCSESVREKILDGRINDVGYDQLLNYESLVDIKPDVVFLFGVDASVTTTIRKLAELGIPAVICADYLENEPLGKSEWIRFFAEFFEKQELADSLFAAIESRYLGIRDKLADVQERPQVLCGLPWKESWYVPGGNSFSARYIEDAGGAYLWRENTSYEAVPLDLEAVYARALSADIWINSGDAQSLRDIEEYDERFANLPVFIKGEIYNNIGRMNAAGGNEYWESGILEPDRILADLAAIFHPGIREGHVFTYYEKLK